MIYQTYTCSMQRGTIEYGFCFYENEGDEDCCIEAEIVVGYTAVITPENRAEEIAKMERQWKKYEWMAKAVCRMAP